MKTPRLDKLLDELVVGRHLPAANLPIIRAAIASELDRLRARLAAVEAESQHREDETDKLRLSLADAAAGNSTLSDRVAELEAENEELRKLCGMARSYIVEAHAVIDENEDCIIKNPQEWDKIEADLEAAAKGTR